MGYSLCNSSGSVHDYRMKVSNAIDQLNEQLLNTDRALETVSSEWLDGKFEDFHKNFSEDKEKINPLCEKLKEYVDATLKKLEDKLLEYEDLEGRMNL